VTVSKKFPDISDKTTHVDFKIRYQSAQKVLKFLKLMALLDQEGQLLNLLLLGTNLASLRSSKNLL
jgi:hypothetical protein